MHTVHVALRLQVDDLEVEAGETASDAVKRIVETAVWGAPSSLWLEEERRAEGIISITELL